VADEKTRNGEQKKPLRLTEKQKRFVVEMLACHEPPLEVVKALKLEFKLDVTRQAVERYDPTTAAGQELSEKLKDYFWEVRQKWDEQAEQDLIGNIKHRLGVYRSILRRAVNRGDDRLALEVMKQTAQDKGGAFTNRRVLDGKVELSTEEQKRELAAAMLKKLVAEGKSKVEARTELIRMGVDERHLPTLQDS
jgi:hypothetical protein